MSEGLRKQTLPLGKLCPTCHNIFAQWDVIIEVYFEAVFHHPRVFLKWYKTPRNWILSVNDGCVFCLRMFDSLEKEEAENLIQSLASSSEVSMKTNFYHKGSKGWTLHSSFYSAGQTDLTTKEHDLARRFGTPQTSLEFQESGTSGE
jgi:hypothetical protein